MKHSRPTRVDLPVSLYDDLQAGEKGTVSAKIRGLLTDYVEGRVTVHDDRKMAVKGVTFLAEPTLIENAVGKAKGEGMSLTRLITLLLKNKKHENEHLDNGPDTLAFF